jgi:hypothetical protein
MLSELRERDQRLATSVADESRDMPERRYPLGDRGDAAPEEQRQDIVAETRQGVSGAPGAIGRRPYYLAQPQADGTYSVTLTEDGIEMFEVALGIAHDLSSRSPISPDSTIADIMERTATREELSRVLRQGYGGLPRRVRTLVLERKLRGTEKPSSGQIAISRIGKALIVCLVALWAVQQFAITMQDIGDVPRILAGLPGDIVNLQPAAAFDQVGNRISDAYRHILVGVLGACLTYIVATVLRPFGTIYRKDQLVPGERTALRLLNELAGALDKRSHYSPEAEGTGR